MTNFLRIAAVVAISAFCCRCSWADELSARALNSTGLQLRWSSQAVMNTTRDSVRHVTNDEELIFFQSSAGVVTALNAETGRRLWAIQIGRSDEVGMAAVTNRDTALIVVGPVIHGLDKFTGEQVFSYRLPSLPIAPPAVYEYELSGQPGQFEYGFLIPLIDGSVVSYQIERLKFQQRYGRLPPRTPTALSWRYFSGENIQFSPISGHESIVIGTDAGNVHAVNVSGINTGKSLYQLFLRSAISSPLRYANRPESEVVYLTTADNRVFCFTLTKGAHMVWTFPVGHAVSEAVIPVDDDVYVVTDGGGVSALSADYGFPQAARLHLIQALTVPMFGLPVGVSLAVQWPWDVPGIRTVVAVSRNRLYGVDSARRLAVIDRHTSKVLSRIPIRGYTIPVRNALTDRIYLASQSGEVVCLAETGSDFSSDDIIAASAIQGLFLDWSSFPIASIRQVDNQFATYHQNPDRQPLMPDVPARGTSAASDEDPDSAP